MTTTNLDLSQYDVDHERILAKWDVQECKRELCKTHPRSALLAPTLALAWFRLRRKILRLWESPLAYTIRFEFRHIAPRIRFQCAETTSLDMCAGHDYLRDSNGHLSLDTDARARIQDMQSLAASHPWFGTAEQWAFLRGWEAGARWAESKSHSSHKE
jgi:hypothetical protein